MEVRRIKIRTLGPLPTLIVYFGLNKVGDDGARRICAWSEITTD